MLSVQQVELSIERIMFHGLQTQRLNLKALELAKAVKWPLFENLAAACNTEQVSYQFVDSRLLLVYVSSSLYLFMKCGSSLSVDFVA